MLTVYVCISQLHSERMHNLVERLSAPSSLGLFALLVAQSNERANQSVIARQLRARIADMAASRTRLTLSLTWSCIFSRSRKVRELFIVAVRPKIHNMQNVQSVQCVQDVE